ncbi:MAG: GGDEF domain-containing protein [Nocardioidaceae bacterium]
MFKDISLACTRMEQQLQALDSESGFDALTGLKNWQSENDDLIGVFPSSTERRRPLSISLVDLDGMRALNEHAGHAVGDAELQRVASVLQHTLRSGDWVGRWGGDEFLVACQNDIATMEKLMRRVRQTLAADVTNRNNLTVSVGVAEVGRDESIEDSLHRAERALEKAKQDGADRVHAG